MDAVTIRQDRKAEMAYVGERPWHGLGEKLEVGQSIEVWKKAAGMDWKVNRSRVRFGDGPNQKVWGDHHVLFRSDTKQPLGLVSAKYKTVQPGETLEFFRDLVDGNGYAMNTAGTLFDGKRFWALASVGEEAVVVGEDRIGGFLLLSTSCDGTLATTARFTTVRVVCNNTLSMALSGKAKSEVVVNHRSTFDADSVKDRLGLARGQFRDFVLAARGLAKVSVQHDVAARFVEQLLLDTKMVTKADVAKTAGFQKIMSLFSGSAMGGTLLGAEGTAWGLVNAVTEYVDHHAKAKTDSHRLAAAWFGRGDDLKTAALEKALAL